MEIPKKLPEFKGYTVDLRLKQFRKIDHKNMKITFIDFDSKEGKRLLAGYSNIMPS
ncbi:MAG: hypothetical protein NT001_02015 [Candidatus Woesearchaeota archaeon]|nr:hypothetical protein [Candidatus Woesearchaeota archaeon]